MRRRRSPTSALSDALAAMLLKGTHARPPTPVSDAEVQTAFWDTYCTPLATMWAQHEVELRERARRWGWAPDADETDPTPRFYAERFWTHEQRRRDRDVLQPST